MNEHLFKLKREGKTVGYLLLEDGFLQASTNGKNYFYVQAQSPAGGLLIYPSNNLFWLDYDTAHPFVTKDNSGKDVFADDKIKALYFWPDAKKPQTITGKVGWRDETLNWVLYHTPNTPECAFLWQLHDIELIEDKEDD